jgi:MFS transporter, DHA2 family, multidrug resistance protein
MGARPLSYLGFLASVHLSCAMTLWTSDISSWTIIHTPHTRHRHRSCIRAAPQIIFATLPLQLRTEVTGIFSLLCGLESAVGISVMSSQLQINIQINHAIIAGSVTPFNRALQTGADESHTAN